MQKGGSTEGGVLILYTFIFLNYYCTCDDKYAVPRRWVFCSITFFILCFVVSARPILECGCSLPYPFRDGITTFIYRKEIHRPKEAHQLRPYLH
jgi:hypothetical protein